MKQWRFTLIFILFLILGSLLLIRLADLQIRKGEYYQALAQGQQSAAQALQGERGQIFFQAGQTLATNLPSYRVSVSFKKIEDKAKVIHVFAQALSIDEQQISEQFKKAEASNQDQTLNYILSETQVAPFINLKLAGVTLQSVTTREYPQKYMAAQAVGFFGGDQKGQYGIEGYYDELLQGKEGVLADGLGDRAMNGADLYLALDYNIQFKAEQLLSQAKKDLDIESGQIVVMDPNSGKLIALAGIPSFDPNHYNEIKDLSLFQNSVIQRPYEPGSVFKPITMAAAIDRDKITPQTTYEDKGALEIGGYTIHNYAQRIWGKRTMTQVLENSINTGAVFAETQLGNKAFMEYLDRFGFFEPTGIDLQGEVTSENREFKKGYEINFANASFGQGIQITPIQLLRAFAAIANGGKLVKPYVVERISDYNLSAQGSGMSGEADGMVKVSPQVSSDRVISPQTASQVTAMLVSVVQNGFGKKAGIPGYYVAGKTGTAQIPWSAFGVNQKGYSEKTWQSFIGFAPAFSPKFLILVKLDNPKAKTAEYSAVPLFHELAKYIIDYLQIPPDYTQESPPQSP